MTLTSWTPEPAPFGNATGFDTVALDVQVTIAETMGMTVYRGCLPEDIQAEQEAMPASGSLRDPLKAITISWDGLSISGEYDGRRSVRGYRSSFWLDQLTPETVVFDVRTLEWEDAKRYSIRGPLCGVDLPDGVVSKLGPIDPIMAGVAEDYMRSVGTSLDETGAEVQS